MSIQPLMLTGPVDAISFIPHMLGFYPEDSIVLFNIDTSVVVRMDHPRGPEDMLRAVVRSVAVADQLKDSRVLMMSYCDDEAYAWAAVTLLREYIPARQFFESLRIYRGTYWTEPDMFRGPGQRYIATDFSAIGLHNRNVSFFPKERA